MPKGLIKNKCGKSDLNFYKWFVGFTDGDGCFNIYTNFKNKKIIFTFKISQKSNNIQVLHLIKKKLGVGSIVSHKDGMSSFLIRKLNHLENIIIPIFDKNPLLTCKEYKFLNFKYALYYHKYCNDNNHKKIIFINENYKHDVPKNYLASSWNLKIFDNNFIDKAWLVGFIEAEGSFYIVKKDENRLTHGFGLTQKLDKHILLEIKKILKIESSVKWNKNGFYSLDSTNKKSLKFIKDYFFKCMFSRKSLDFRLWSRSFRYKGNYDKLLRIKKIMIKLRNN